MPSLLSSRMLPGPNTLRYVELFLADLDGLGLEYSAITDILSTVDAYVDGFAQREAAGAETRRQAGMTEAEWQDALSAYYERILANGQYPMLARLIAENRDISASANFESGLECVLDGIEVRIAAARRQRDREATTDTPPPPPLPPE